VTDPEVWLPQIAVEREQSAGCNPATGVENVARGADIARRA
jgi:hypothetical protein